MKSFFRRIYSKIKADPSWSFFLAFAFLSAVSLPLARAAMVLSLVFTLASPARRRSIRITSPTLGWLVYLALAAVVTAAMWALDPEPGLLEPARGFRKLDKLLWYAAIPLAVAQVDSRTRLMETLRALVWGGALAAAGVILVNPLLAWVQVSLPSDVDIAAGTAAPAAEWLFRAAEAVGKLDELRGWALINGQPQTFQAALIKVGTMQAAQRLMVAVLAALCLLLEAFCEPSRGRRFGAALLLLLCTAGLVLTYKRGPLMACAAVSFAILLSRLSVWRAILVAALLAVAFGGVAATVPPVRERFGKLPAELDLRQTPGGRMAMWTVIVPELHREHPWGIGFRALTWNKIFDGMPELVDARDPRIRLVNRRIELNQNHMHSVPMQAFVDFGYAGLLAWLFWMMLGFRSTMRLARLARRPAPGSSLPETACFAAPLAMFAALFLYGLVEYNLADSEVVLLYALAMGLSGPSLLHAAPDPAAGNQAPTYLLPGRRRTWAWLAAYVVLGAALCGGYALLCRSYLRILAAG